MKKPDAIDAQRPRIGWHEARFIESATKVECVCIECSTHYWLPKSKVEMYVTCGAGCAKKRRERAKRSRARNCLTCGNEFIARTTQLANGTGLYCSQQCNTKGHKAMNTAHSQEKARAAWKTAYAANPFNASGEKNNRWSGGPSAKKARDKANGWPLQSARRAKCSKSLPSGLIEKIGRSQKWICVVCRVSIKTKYHIDHINPLALGGAHEAGNIQLLCPTCNLRKSKKDPIRFMQSMGFLL